MGEGIVGEPGNPVSSMVSYELFARPGLRSMMGFPQPVRPTIQGIAATPLQRRSDGKIHFARVDVKYEGSELAAHSISGQGSHMLAAMARSNALAVLPDGEGCQPGDPVDLLLLQ